MKIYFRALLVTLLFAVGLVSAFMYWKDRTSPKAAEMQILSMEQMETVGLPGFEATTLQNEKFQLQDLKGKIVILNFWASWCGPCVEEFPSLIRLVEEMKGKAVLIAVSGDSSRSDIDGFLVHLKGWQNPNVKIVWDEDRKLTQLYDVERLPESYVSNTRLQLVKKIVGSVNWYTPDSMKYMEEVYQK